MSGFSNPEMIAPIIDRSEQAILTPGGNVIPAMIPPERIPEIDKEIMMAGKEAMKKQQQPNNLGAMLLAGQLLNPPQQERPMPSFGDIRKGQQVSITDPVAALLAPKRKKERPMISLL